MKKFLTLALLMGATYFASAQGTREMEDVKDVILGPRKGSGNTSGSDKDVILGKDDRRVYEEDRRYPSRTSGSTEANRINREYDAKIQSIRNNRQLSSAEKERAIRQLENDRNRKLRSLDERYSKDRRRYEDRDRRYDDRDDDDRRYSKDKNKNYKKKKGNNGNHYGWQKGKGNPHRDRD